MLSSSSNGNDYEPLANMPGEMPTMKKNAKFFRNRKHLFLYIGISFCILALAGYHLNTVSDTMLDGEIQPKRVFRTGVYMGMPWKSSRTVSKTTLGETEFARCEVHSVRKEDGSGVIDDWIFIEEMDAVNVAVITADLKFAMFEQSKYAIPGTTLSPVGGFVDGGEAPWESARREVMEELGLGSPKTLQAMREAGYESLDERTGKNIFNMIPKMPRTEDKYGLAVGDTDANDTNWVFLGRYRTAANRGGGFVYTYLLKNAYPILPNGGTPGFRSSGDDEAQALRLLSIDEVAQRIDDFQEIKWAATMSMSMLHLKSS